MTDWTAWVVLVLFGVLVVGVAVAVTRETPLDSPWLYVAFVGLFGMIVFMGVVGLHHAFNDILRVGP